MLQYNTKCLQVCGWVFYCSAKSFVVCTWAISAITDKPLSNQSSYCWGLDLNECNHTIKEYKIISWFPIAVNYGLLMIPCIMTAQWLQYRNEYSFVDLWKSSMPRRRFLQLTHASNEWFEIITDLGLLIWDGYFLPYCNFWTCLSKVNWKAFPLHISCKLIFG